MRAQEGFLATDATPFKLRGGVYAVSVTATFGGGSVKLQAIQADGSTYASVGSSTDFTAAAFVTGLALPPGTYKFLITTATAVKGAIDRIPGE